MSETDGRVFLLYQFFHPDDVISARLFSDLAAELSKDGLEVIAFPAIYSCHGNARKHVRIESWEGGRIQRVWRPNFKQSSTIGRLLNCFFMLVAWSWLAIVAPRTRWSGNGDTVVIGTDPIFGVLAAIPWRFFRPKSKIILWCHDLHPDASIAEGTFSETSLLIQSLRFFMGLAYRRCDTIVDLGVCMRHRLQFAVDRKNSTTRPGEVTITPWSLVEDTEVSSVDVNVRKALFDDSRLALLYSGNLGRAHAFEPYLELAKQTRAYGFHFCFAGRGPGTVAINTAVEEQRISNVSIAGFAAESELQARLSCCDIHMVSLKPSWTGTVVPSKYFGALAIGRPVLFAGSSESCIALWIKEFGTGWVLDIERNNISEVGEMLLDYSNNPKLREETNSRCIRVYLEYFSKASQVSRFKQLIQSDALDEVN